MEVEEAWPFPKKGAWPEEEEEEEAAVIVLKSESRELLFMLFEESVNRSRLKEEIVYRKGGFIESLSLSKKN